jgi:hypothetical protein
MAEMGGYLGSGKRSNVSVQIEYDIDTQARIFCRWKRHKVYLKHLDH